MSAPPTPSTPLLELPLGALHRALGARMVPFAGYSMPIQYPTGLLAEHRHTRVAAGLFDVSHMGQLRLIGTGAARAVESLMPVDIVDLPVGKQRYGLLTNEHGGILDDLMVVNCGGDLLLIVNGACKAQDIAHITSRIGGHCEVRPAPDQALLALQGPLAASVLGRFASDIDRLVFMTGGRFEIAGCDCYVTRSGYTGEDGFEISVPADDVETLARLLLNQHEVVPVGLGARNSLRLEAGLCLHGSDIDARTTPVEAGLQWAIPKIRRAGGARAGGFPGAETILMQLADSKTRLERQRVGLIALQRIPVREHSELQDPTGQQRIGEVTSGLLSPTLGEPIAMGYVPPAFAAIGTPLEALVRGQRVAMRVSALPFVPANYVRGPLP
ncbi:MAG: glycine cleavage system aminomethyltransferase GcvT [Burkholderiaceae bacterium]